MLYNTYRNTSPVFVTFVTKIENKTQQIQTLKERTPGREDRSLKLHID